MSKQLNYRKTLLACYLGFITQAIAAIFAPLLFLTFKSAYGHIPCVLWQRTYYGFTNDNAPVWQTKASIEYENESIQRLVNVVTNNGHSDWATTDISSNIKEMWYRFSRRDSDFCIECSTDSKDFRNSV